MTVRIFYKTLFWSILLSSSYSFSKNSTKNNQDALKTIKQIITDNDLEKLKSHLKDVNIQNESGHSALYIAIRQKNLEIARWLIEEKNANINIQTRFGKTPLHQAVHMNHLPLVELLLKNKASVHTLDQQKNTALHYAVQNVYPSIQKRNTQTSIIEKLIQHKSKVETKNALLETALHVAAQKGNTRAVSLLIKYKSPIDAQNFYGKTALHFALIGLASAEKNLKENFKSIIKTLLSHNADAGIADQDKRTALHIAAENGFTDIVENIIEKNPKLINAQTTEGWTALHLASGNRHTSTVQLLIAKGADVNIEAKDGSTPIHFAIGAGSKEVVATLLKSKAGLFFKDPKTNKDKLDSGTQKKLQSLLSKFYGQSKK